MSHLDLPAMLRSRVVLAIAVVLLVSMRQACHARPSINPMDPWMGTSPLFARADNDTKNPTSPGGSTGTGTGTGTDTSTTTTTSSNETSTTYVSKAPAIRVKGNLIVDGQGKAIQLHGVAIQGTEYQCAHGFGFGEGNGLNQEEVDGILTWQPNAVRVGLNQGCWLGETIPGFNNTQYIGAPYRKRMTQWVNLLLSNGLVVIIDLHWSSGGWVSLGQQIMPDTKSVTFWKSVASTINQPGVIYDLYNEPYPKSWECWRDAGDACADEDKSKLNFTAVGVQALVNAIRGAGSKAPLLIECTEGDGGADFSKYVKWAPKDPMNNIIAGIHLYSTLGNCNQPTCYKEQMSAVAKHFPILVGELGQFMCNKTWFETAATFFDSLSISYIVWSWFKPYGTLPAENPQDCSNLPYLIKDWSGEANNYGVDVKRHFAKYKGGSTATVGGNTTSTGSGDTTTTRKRCKQPPSKRSDTSTMRRDSL